MPQHYEVGHDSCEGEAKIPSAPKTEDGLLARRVRLARGVWLGDIIIVAASDKALPGCVDEFPFGGSFAREV